MVILTHLVCHRRQKPLLRLDDVGPDIVEHKAARAVRALGHAGPEALMAYESCLLVSQTAGDGHAIDGAVLIVHRGVHLCRRPEVQF